MKKILMLFPVILIGLCTGLSSCNNTNQEKYTLTYGTYVDEGAKKIHYSDLASKMLDKESMIVVTYDSDDSHCSCWSAFSFAIDKVVKEENYLIYKIVSSEFNGQDNFGFSTFYDRPSIHFVKDGKLVEKIDYTVTDLNPLFKGSAALKLAIEERTFKPNYYFINQEQFETHIENKDDFIVSYYWDSCGDCKYSFPRFLYDFTKNKEFDTDMYLLNLEVEGLLLNEGNKDINNPNYIEFLTKYNLNSASNHPLGYDRGFVPTYQYYEDGVLYDASVFFNDAVTQNENNEYYVSRSFYSKERVKNLKYLDKLNEGEKSILEGMIIPNEQISEKGTWIQEYAYEYHAPLLNAFLTTYAFN